MIIKSFLRKSSAVALLLLLAGCGGGGIQGDDNGSTPPPDDPSASTIGTIELQAESLTIGTARGSSLTLTASVKSHTNNLLPDIPVEFEVDSGELAVLDSATSSSFDNGEFGKANAVFSIGSNQANRTIVATARAGNMSDRLEIHAIGTRLELLGPSNIARGGKSGAYSVSLKDSSGNGIANQPIQLTTNAGIIDSSTVDTNEDGLVTFRLNATDVTASKLRLSASSMNLTASRDVLITQEQLVFQEPGNNSLVNINTPKTIKVRLTDSGDPVGNTVVTFNSSRGAFAGSKERTTDSNGEVSVTIESASAGPAIVSATTANGLSAEINLEFVATTPDSITMEAERYQVAPEGSTTITAVVRDANRNLVKGQTVRFTLQNDATSGFLDENSAVTDSFGRASVRYTAGNGSSSRDGVVIAAETGNSVVAPPLRLTVGGSALRITLGTGNTVGSPNSTQYTSPWTAQISDAGGGAIEGRQVTINAVPIAYAIGRHVWLGENWGPLIPSVIWCASEDVNGDGDIESNPALDVNGNGKLDPSGIATTTLSVTTDATGSAHFDITYAKEYAHWVIMELTAQVGVAGSESRETRRFILPGLAADYSEEDIAPPGERSRWLMEPAPGPCTPYPSPY